MSGAAQAPACPAALGEPGGGDSAGPRSPRSARSLLPMARPCCLRLGGALRALLVHAGNSAAAPEVPPPGSGRPLSSPVAKGLPERLGRWSGTAPAAAVGRELGGPGPPSSSQQTMAVNTLVSSAKGKGPGPAGRPRRRESPPRGAVGAKERRKRAEEEGGPGCGGTTGGTRVSWGPWGRFGASALNRGTCTENSPVPSRSGRWALRPVWCSCSQNPVSSLLCKGQVCPLSQRRAGL